MEGVPDPRTNPDDAPNRAHSPRRWLRRAFVALACVIALMVGAGGWVIHANDFAVQRHELTIPGSTQPLHATLALPEYGDGPFGLVVFVHGDGPADATRDSFYEPIWESFAEAGYASVSWNKPGVDGAPGIWLDQTMHDRARETEAVIAWARGRTDIDPRRIGLWGISQAGWVLPEVAANDPALQFLILVGGAVNWLRQGEYNLRAELRHHDAPEPEVAEALDRRNTVLRLLRENATYEQYRAAQPDSPPMSAARWNFVRLNYLSDATGFLPRVQSPVLLVLGDEDLNVDVTETESTYRAHLAPEQLTVHRFPNASHSLVKASFENDQDWRAVATALVAPRSLYVPGYLALLRDYAAAQPPR